MYARKKEESGENSSNSMDVTMDSKGKSEAGDNQEARNSPLPSVSTASAPATPATPATPSTSQTKQPRQKKGQSCQIWNVSLYWPMLCNNPWKSTGIW